MLRIHIQHVRRVKNPFLGLHDSQNTIDSMFVFKKNDKKIEAGILHMISRH